MLRKLNKTMDDLEVFMEARSQYKHLQLVQDEIDSLEKKLAGVKFFLRQFAAVRRQQKRPCEVLEALIKDIEADVK